MEPQASLIFFPAFRIQTGRRRGRTVTLFASHNPTNKAASTLCASLLFSAQTARTMPRLFARHQPVALISKVKEGSTAWLTTGLPASGRRYRVAKRVAGKEAQDEEDQRESRCQREDRPSDDRQDIVSVGPGGLQLPAESVAGPKASERIAATEKPQASTGAQTSGKTERAKAGLAPKADETAACGTAAVALSRNATTHSAVPSAKASKAAKISGAAVVPTRSPALPHWGAMDVIKSKGQVDNDESMWVQCDQCFKWRKGTGGTLPGGVCIRWCCSHSGRDCGEACDWCRDSRCRCNDQEDYDGYQTRGYRLPVGFWTVVRFRNSDQTPVGPPWLTYRSRCPACGVMSGGIDRREKMQAWLGRHSKCVAEWRGLSTSDFDFKLDAETRSIYKDYLQAVKRGMRLSFEDLTAALKPCRDAQKQPKWRAVKDVAPRLESAKLRGLLVPKSSKDNGGELGRVAPSSRPSNSLKRVHDEAGTQRTMSSTKKLCSHSQSRASSALGSGIDRETQLSPSKSNGVLEACANEKVAKGCRLEELVLAAEQEMLQMAAAERQGPAGHPENPQSLLGAGLRPSRSEMQKEFHPWPDVPCPQVSEQQARGLWQAGPPNEFSQAIPRQMECEI